MDLYVIRRPSAWGSLQELQAAGAKSGKIGDEEMPDRVRWIRSYVVKEADGRLGAICIYEAQDTDSLREHAASACPGMRFSRCSTPLSYGKIRLRQPQPP